MRNPKFARTPSRSCSLGRLLIAHVEMQRDSRPYTAREPEAHIGSRVRKLLADCGVADDRGRRIPKIALRTERPRTARRHPGLTTSRVRETAAARRVRAMRRPSPARRRQPHPRNRRARVAGRRAEAAARFASSSRRARTARRSPPTACRPIRFDCRSRDRNRDSDCGSEAAARPRRSSRRSLRASSSTRLHL